jgi:hypothetical protein
MRLAGLEPEDSRVSGQGHFVEAPGLPDRFEDSQGNPAWQRAIAIAAARRLKQRG